MTSFHLDIEPLTNPPAYDHPTNYLSNELFSTQVYISLT